MIQDRLKTEANRTDISVVTDELTRSMHLVLHHLVEQTPGVTGALVASADGFVLASRLPTDREIDPAGLGAMSAAALALSNQLVSTSGASPASVSQHRSADGQVLIVPVVHVAVLTVLVSADADIEQMTAVAREAATGLQRLFRGMVTA